MISGRAFLLDTNVISELKKTRPDQKVLRFVQELPESRAFLSALTLGELRKGAALQAKRDTAAAKLLSDWIDRTEEQYAGRVLAVDGPIARIWGELCSDRSRPLIDTLLAATAIHHGLTLVTRNTRDVEDTPAALLNPWLAP